MVDYLDYAHHVVVKPVHEKVAANDTGYHTPEELYDIYAPFAPRRIIIHGTVGSNTLPYFANKVDSHWNILEEAGSVLDGRQVLAHQLISKDDYTIFDMVPEGYGCGHCNPGVLKGQGTLNFNAYGIELENLQNGDSGDPFTESQYIKAALTVAFKAASHGIKGMYIGTHWDASMGAILAEASTNNAAGTLALAKNAHRDPYSGPFDSVRFYGHLFAVCQVPAVFAYWNVPIWVP